MVTLYGLKNCSTCKKALQWMSAQNIEHEFIDYRQSPLSRSQVERYGEQLGWGKLINRASTTWRNLPEGQKEPQNNADWLGLVEAHPTLIRRPLAVSGDEVRAGFKPDEWVDWLA